MLRLIGLDIGTTTISAVAVNGETGEILKAVTVPNDSVLHSGDTVRKMQDPNIIRDKVLALKDSLAAEFSPIAAIGVTGQMHGIVYLDRNGNAASPLYTWQDAAGGLPYQGSTYAQYLSEKTGYALASGYGLVTDYVNRDLGLVSKDAVTLCTIHDYIAMCLCGRTSPLVHSSDAASLGCFDLNAGSFDQAALETLGLDPAFLPEVTSGFTVAGHTADGIPVTVAIGDNQASVLGAVKGDGCALVNIGTGSQVSVITHSAAAFDAGEVRPLADNRFMLVGAPLCGGRSYALLRDFFRQCAALFGGDTENVYAVMNEIAAQAPSERPLKVDTRFCGTRKEPALTGSIRDISDSNFTPAALTRGFLWGMAEELYGFYEKMLPLSDMPITTLAGSGNAIRKNPVLKAYLEECFGLPLHIPAHQEEAAFGAAVFAAVASGIYPGLAQAQSVLVHYL